MSVICSHAPKGFSPRPYQQEVFEELEAKWQGADVFVLRLPTAWGKMVAAMTVLKWANKEDKRTGIWINPTKLLVDQATRTFPRLHAMRSKSSYMCLHREGNTCADTHREEEEHCGMCPYKKAVKMSHVVPYMTANYHTYLAHKLYKECLIVDEAHLLIKIARDRAAKRLWYKDYGYPTGISTYGALLNWVESHPLRETDVKLKLLLKELSEGRHKYLVEKSLELYRGREELVLKLLPLDVSDQCGFLWPSKKGKKPPKIVLMSATIGEQDIKDLGLNSRRVVYIDAKSPIPIDRRPFHIAPIASLNYHSMDTELPKIADFINECLKLNPEKGLIHAPYSMARRLQNLLNSPRLVYHDQDNKTERFNEFYNSDPKEGKVLVCSGLYEGISLDGDTGRWQVITKVPYQSLAEPAIKYKAEQDPQWYAWQAATLVIQAVGRICRGPNDFGETIILDKNFNTLYNNYRNLFPKWFIEGVIEQ